MDKRWIYIIIILLIGVTALFFIVQSSTTLGSAETYVPNLQLQYHHHSILMKVERNMPC